MIRKTMFIQTVIQSNLFLNLRDEKYEINEKGAEESKEFKNFPQDFCIFYLLLSISKISNI
jgi:hypothetical protein